MSLCVSGGKTSGYVSPIFLNEDLAIIVPRVEPMPMKIPPITLPNAKYTSELESLGLSKLFNLRFANTAKNNDPVLLRLHIILKQKRLNLFNEFIVLFKYHVKHIVIRLSHIPFSHQFLNCFFCQSNSCKIFFSLFTHYLFLHAHEYINHMRSIVSINVTQPIYTCPSILIISDGGEKQAPMAEKETDE